MKYIICSDREGKIKPLEGCPDESTAIKRLKYHYKREKCLLKIVPIPEMGIGTKIYKRDGQYFGNIVYETSNLWGISHSSDETMPDPYLKGKMDQIITALGLVVVDGIEVSDADEMEKRLSDLQNKIRAALKGLDYIGAEQVTFF